MKALTPVLVIDNLKGQEKLLHALSVIKRNQSIFIRVGEHQTEEYTTPCEVLCLSPDTGKCVHRFSIDKAEDTPLDKN